jgi:hypothetical protein
LDLLKGLLAMLEWQSARQVVNKISTEA